MELIKDPGLFRKGKGLFTENLRPGESVYGESLEREREREFRRFDPFRTKLAAYVAKGGREWPFDHVQRLLYLGAGSGTTVSHLSDILPKARIYAVERYPKPFASLLQLSEKRENLYPILADAQLPERYRFISGEVDVIYQDVAQRNQVEILLDNVWATLNPHGWVFLQLKIRSMTQAESPKTVLKKAEGQLEENGMEVVEKIDLAPFSKDHYTILLRPLSKSS